MKKIMVSQPMNGLTDEEIGETRDKFLKFAKENNFEVINSYFKDEFKYKEFTQHQNVENISVYFLSKAIDVMSKCNNVYFAKGWDKARGCKIEHEIAKQYGLEIIYEE